MTYELILTGKFKKSLKLARKKSPLQIPVQQLIFFCKIIYKRRLRQAPWINGM